MSRLFGHSHLLIFGVTVILSIISSGQNLVSSEPLICADHSQAKNALHFEEASLQYVEVSDDTAFIFPSRSSFTIELWYKPSSLSGDTLIVSKFKTGRKNQGGWFFGLQGDTPMVWRGESASFPTLVANQSISLNVWNHIATTYDGAMLRIYVNGTNAGELESTGNMFERNLPGVYICASFDTPSPNDLCDGTLDELRVWTSARNADDIETDSGCSYNLAYYDILSLNYRLNQASGTDLSDDAGHYDGTIAGGASWVTSTAPVCRICDCLGTYDCAGVCDGSNTYDCLGTCNGTAILDCMNICNGPNHETSTDFSVLSTFDNATFVAGTTGHVVIESYDIYQNRKLIGGDSYNVSIFAYYSNVSRDLSIQPEYLTGLNQLPGTPAVLLTEGSFNLSSPMGIIQHGNGSYLVTMQTNTSGLYYFSTALSDTCFGSGSDVSVMGFSPFGWKVVPAESFPASCIASGSGLQATVYAGELGSILLQLSDIYGNNRTFEGNFTASSGGGGFVQGPAYDLVSIIAKNLFDMSFYNGVARPPAVNLTTVQYVGAGIYELAYNLTMTGSYDISIDVNRIPLYESPYSVEIVPSTLPGLFYCTTDNLPKFVARIVPAGSLFNFSIISRDVFGNNYTSSMNVQYGADFVPYFAAEFVPVSGGVSEFINATDMDTGIHFVQNVITKAGDYEVKIRLVSSSAVGDEILLSPYPLRVVPNFALASKCSASGLGIGNSIPTHFDSYFNIIALDLYDNYRNIENDTFTIVSTPAANFSVSNNGGGTYIVDYKIATAGLYSVQVLLLEYSAQFPSGINRNISVSPILINVLGPITISSLSPDIASIGNTLQISIAGNNFWSLVRCEFLPTINSSLSLVNTVEFKTISTISVSVDIVEGLVPQNVTVRCTGNNVSWAEIPLELIEAPTLANIAPRNGPTLGGIKVTFTGENFVDSTYFCCKFGTVVTAVEEGSITTVLVNGQYVSQAICLTPPSSSYGPVAVYVSNDGQIFSKEVIYFRYSTFWSPYCSIEPTEEFPSFVQDRVQGNWQYHPNLANPILKNSSEPQNSNLTATVYSSECGTVCDVATVNDNDFCCSVTNASNGLNCGIQLKQNATDFVFVSVVLPKQAFINEFITGWNWPCRNEPRVLFMEYRGVGGEFVSLGYRNLDSSLGFKRSCYVIPSEKSEVSLCSDFFEDVTGQEFRIYFNNSVPIMGSLPSFTDGGWIYEFQVHGVYVDEPRGLKITSGLTTTVKESYSEKIVVSVGNEATVTSTVNQYLPWALVETVNHHNEIVGADDAVTTRFNFSLFVSTDPVVAAAASAFGALVETINPTDNMWGRFVGIGASNASGFGGVVDYADVENGALNLTELFLMSPIAGSYTVNITSTANSIVYGLLQFTVECGIPVSLQCVNRTVAGSELALFQSSSKVTMEFKLYLTDPGGNFLGSTLLESTVVAVSLKYNSSIDATHLVLENSLNRTMINGSMTYMVELAAPKAGEYNATFTTSSFGSVSTLFKVTPGIAKAIRVEKANIGPLPSQAEVALPNIHVDLFDVAGIFSSYENIATISIEAVNSSTQFNSASVLEKVVSGGSVEFDSLVLLSPQAGIHVIAVSSNSSSISNTTIFVEISLGPATSLKIFTIFGSVAASLSVSLPSIEIYSIDAGLSVLSENDGESWTISVQLVEAPPLAPIGILTGQLEVTMKNGSANFTGITLAAPIVGQYVLQFSSPSLQSANWTVEITIGNAFKLDIESPSNITSQSLASVILGTIKIRTVDAGGTPCGGVDNSTRNITAVLYNSVGNIVSGYSSCSSIAMVEGVKTLENCFTLSFPAVSNYDLVFFSNGIANATLPIYIRSGPPYRLIVKSIDSGPFESKVSTGLGEISVALSDAGGSDLAGEFNSANVSVRLLNESSVLFGSLNVSSENGSFVFVADSIFLSSPAAGVYYLEFSSVGLVSIMKSVTVVVGEAVSTRVVSSSGQSSLTTTPAAVLVRVPDIYVYALDAGGSVVGSKDSSLRPIFVELLSEDNPTAAHLPTIEYTNITIMKNGFGAVSSVTMVTPKIGTYYLRVRTTSLDSKLIVLAITEGPATQLYLRSDLEYSAMVGGEFLDGYHTPFGPVLNTVYNTDRNNSDITLDTIYATVMDGSKNPTAITEKISLNRTVTLSSVNASSMFATAIVGSAFETSYKTLLTGLHAISSLYLSDTSLGNCLRNDTVNGTMISGNISFSNIKISPKCGACILKLSSPGLDAAYILVSIVPGDPHTLLLSNPPFAQIVSNNVAFSPAPEVYLADSAGNRVAMAVTISAKFVPSIPSVSSVASASNGWGSFTSLSVTGIRGKSYELHFESVSISDIIPVTTNTNITIQPCPLLEEPDEATQTTCVCSLGLIRNSITGDCVSCPIDTYADRIGSISCAACPSNTSSHGSTGLTSAKQCTCRVGMYSLVEGANTGCRYCEDGAACGGGSEIESMPGFWRMDESSVLFFKCRYGAACLGGKNSSCLKGYYGPLCSECAPGYGQFGATCSECLPVVLSWLLIILFGIVLSLLFTLMVKTAQQKRGELQMNVRIIVNYIQVTSFCSEFHVDWPPFVLEFFKLLQLGVFSFRLHPFSCALSIDYFSESTFYILLPIVCAVATAFAAGIYWIFLNRVSLKARFVSSNDRVTPSGDASVAVVPTPANPKDNGKSRSSPTDSIKSSETDVSPLRNKGENNQSRLESPTRQQPNNGSKSNSPVRLQPPSPSHLFPTVQRARARSVSSPWESDENLLKQSFRSPSQLASAKDRPVYSRFEKWSPSDFGIVVLLILYLYLHPIITRNVMSIMNCRSFDNGISYYLVDNLTVQCTTKVYQTLMIFAILLLFYFSVGFPLGLLYFFMKYHKKILGDVSGLRKKFRFLMDGYRVQLYWWEIVIIARKVGIVSIAVFFSGVPLTQLYLGVWVIGAALFMHLYYRPFQRSLEAMLETFSILATLVTLLTGYLFYTPDELSPAAYSFISIVIMFFHVIVFVVLFYLFTRALKRFNEREKFLEKAWNSALRSTSAVRKRVNSLIIGAPPVLTSADLDGNIASVPLGISRMKKITGKLKRVRQDMDRQLFEKAKVIERSWAVSPRVDELRWEPEDEDLIEKDDIQERPGTPPRTPPNQHGPIGESPPAPSPLAYGRSFDDMDIEVQKHSSAGDRVLNRISKSDPKLFDRAEAIPKTYALERDLSLKEMQEQSKKVESRKDNISPRKSDVQHSFSFDSYTGSRSGSHSSDRVKPVEEADTRQKTAPDEGPTKPRRLPPLKGIESEPPALVDYDMEQPIADSVEYGVLSKSGETSVGMDQEKGYGGIEISPDNSPIPFERNDTLAHEESTVMSVDDEHFRKLSLQAELAEREASFEATKDVSSEEPIRPATVQMKHGSNGPSLEAQPPSVPIGVGGRISHTGVVRPPPGMSPVGGYTLTSRQDGNLPTRLGGGQRRQSPAVGFGVDSFGISSSSDTSDDDDDWGEVVDLRD